jgi:hypothetical protein
MSNLSKPDTDDNTIKEYDLSSTPFSWDKLDGLLAYKSSLRMCSEILDVPATTIHDHIKRRYNKTFTDYAEDKLSVTKLKLVQKAIKMAEKGDRVMLIFCLKNICKWQDKIEEKITSQQKIELAYKVIDSVKGKSE